jgi:diguanylate cyclase (GGDEF)-like protein
MQYSGCSTRLLTSDAYLSIDKYFFRELKMTLEIVEKIAPDSSGTRNSGPSIDDDIRALRHRMEREAPSKILEDLGKLVPVLSGRSRVEVLALRSTSETRRGNTWKGLSLGSQALDAAILIEDLGLISESMLALGYALQSMGEYERAIELLTNADHICLDASPRLSAQIKRRIGVCHSLLGAHERSLDFLRVAQTCLQEEVQCDESFYVRYSLLNAITRQSAKMTQSPNRKAIFDQLLAQWATLCDLLEKNSLEMLSSMADCNFALAAINAEQFDLAKKILTQNLERCRTHELASQEAITLYHLGSVQGQVGDTESAIATLKSCIAMNAGESPRRKMQAWELLATQYELALDSSAAVDALNHAHQCEREVAEHELQIKEAQAALSEDTRALIAHWTRMARKDALTNLANQQAMDDFLSQKFTSTQTIPNVGLILLDLAYFSGLVGRYGQATGDEVLRRTAEILSSVCKSSDLIARIEQGRFGIVFSDAGLHVMQTMTTECQEAISREDWSSLAPRLEVNAIACMCTSTELDLEPPLASSLVRRALIRLNATIRSPNEADFHV